jgi:hypothetical protein
MITRRAFAGSLCAAPLIGAEKGLRVVPFEADVTPPLGSALCYGLVTPAATVADPLLARGLVLLSDGQEPIVLCALDWLGIGNGGYDRWKQALARAARTTPSRVAIHTVHQHDAPGDDASAAEILKTYRLADTLQSESFAASAAKRVAAAISAAKALAVTHVSWGSAAVDKVASNRRIAGPDGRIAFVRYTACREGPQCDAPEGLIDPLARTVSFWSDQRCVATMAYYATHPMSYYGKGAIGADFVGMARRSQEGFCIYFTGAGGNIGAGKYNNGAPETRSVLAGRLGEGIRQAIKSEQKAKVDAVRWSNVPTALPHREGAEFTEEAILGVLRDEKKIPRDRANAARYLAWHRMVKAGRKIDISALHLAGAHIVHMPGELFVEYQLAAQKEMPRDFVAMAAYGDYGPMYIGTRTSYDQGGYETSAVSRVAPAVEDILLDSIRRVLRG